MTAWTRLPRPAPASLRREGLTSREVLTLLQSMQGLPLAGLDIVEVAPALNFSEATVFVALKFIMEFIALFAREKGKSPAHANP